MTAAPDRRRVTDRIIERSQRRRRRRYLDLMARAGGARHAAAPRCRCGNLAHGFAAARRGQGRRSRAGAGPTSASSPPTTTCSRRISPTGAIPSRSRSPRARSARTAQVAGGVPAMCDGVTQGQTGHGAVAVQPRRDRAVDRGRAEPRHVRRRRAARHLRQDRARPADRRACASAICRRCSCPAGRCPRASPTRRSSASASSTPRARRAARSCSRPRPQSYHAPGTCTFYGTANSNQMMMELMGLHMPGAAFVNPDTPLRAGADPRRGRTGSRDHRAGRRLHARSARRRRREGDRQRAWSACSRPAARPTTRSTCRRSRARPASRSTGRTSTSCRRRCR